MEMKTDLTHFDKEGKAIMVDVTAKSPTARQAKARGQIRMNEAAYQAVVTGTAAKGDVLGIARIAGIMAAKRTGDLIPLCHPLAIASCQVDFQFLPDILAIEAVAVVKLSGQTGVEMEALTAVTVSLLTIYDMCKALDKQMQIEGIHLLHKSGGHSGLFEREHS